MAFGLSTRCRLFRGLIRESARHLVSQPHYRVQIQISKRYTESVTTVQISCQSVRGTPSLGLFRRQSGFLECYHLFPAINSEIGDTDANVIYGYDFAEY